MSTAIEPHGSRHDDRTRQYVSRYRQRSLTPNSDDQSDDGTLTASSPASHLCSTWYEDENELSLSSNSALPPPPPSSASNEDLWDLQHILRSYSSEEEELSLSSDWTLPPPPPSAASNEDLQDLQHILQRYSSDEVSSVAFSGTL